MNFNFQEILTYQFWGNAVSKYLIALGVFLLAIFVLKIFKKVVIQKIKKLAHRTKTEFDDLLIRIIDSIGWSLYVLLSLYIALGFVELSQVLEKLVGYALLISIIYYAVKGAQNMIDYGVQKFVTEKEREDKKIDSSVINLLVRALKGALWAVAALIFLQSMGYNISALVAGLGVGGIAIAFALQNILGDLFASFAIYFDKPFEVGDYIVIGDDAGTVKQIGIKSTRIQSRQGEELVISNKELTSARVHNYKKMERRRIVFSFGLTYETPTEKLRKVPGIIREIIDRIEVTEIDRVFFKEFGEFSLNFEVVYWLKSSDYKGFVESQPKINLAIMEAFQKEGIEMAYPTQTIFVKK